VPDEQVLDLAAAVDEHCVGVLVQEVVCVAGCKVLHTEGVWMNIGSRMRVGVRMAIGTATGIGETRTSAQRSVA